MKKVKILILFWVMMLMYLLSKSQVQNAILRSDGRTILDGVEAYYAKAICNDEKCILIKFINKNEYTVKVKWVDAIFVNGNWYYATNEKSVLLNPGETLGDCNDFKMKVKIGSIIEDPLKFEHYTVSGLTVIK